MKEWLKSVYSDGSKYYVSNPAPKKGETITIRLRVKENTELEKVLLRSKEYGAERIYTMDVDEKIGGLVYYKCDVTVYEEVFHYQFYLVTKNEVYYYTQYRITDYIPEETRDFKILIDYNYADWVSNAVFYQIFPDRFYNGKPEITVKDGEYTYGGFSSLQVKQWDQPANLWDVGHCIDFHGGDLYGIIEKLDYLQELGVTALYLNPIFVSPTNHKYDALDYDVIDPHLGGEDALIKLSEELHKRNMKLMMDISINHVSFDSKWFNRFGQFYPKSVGAYNNKDSEERDYFFFYGDGECDYESWFGNPSMPQINYTNPKVRDIIYRNPDSVLKKYMKAPFNIDAWRFDVADVFARNRIADVYHEVWKEIYNEVKNEKDRFYFLAEDWADCSEMFDKIEWDSTMNYYGCARPIREFVGDKDLFNARNEVLRNVESKLTAKQLRNRIEQFYSRMPHIMATQMFNLLDSHDVPRLHTLPNMNQKEYEGAVTMLFTIPGTASVYYGDEKRLAGRVEDGEGWRFPMDWSETMSDDVADRFERYKKLAHLKQSSDVLKNGGFKTTYDEGYIYSYARFNKEEMLLVICSTEDEDKSITIDMDDFGFQAIANIDEFFGEKITTSFKDGKLIVEVPAHQSYLISIK